MATKKRKAAQAAGTAETTAVDRAWPVAAVVNLTRVLFEEIGVKRSANGLTLDDEADVAFLVESVGIGRHQTEEKIRVALKFSLTLKKQQAPESEIPALRMECTFVLFYDLPRASTFSDEDLVAFAQTTGVFNAWPYWREFVHSTTYRMGLPPIVLPTQRFSSIVAGTDSITEPGRDER